MTNVVATTPEGPSSAPRVSFWTLGCRLNQYDTAALRARLMEAGLDPGTGDPAQSDVILVNTCTVTRRADQEARQLVRRLHRESPGARIVVTGCYAQRAPEELRALPGVSAVLGSAERDNPETLMRAVEGEPGVEVGPARNRRPFATGAPLSIGRSRALLKIQDGCDSFCAYCIVPYVRGRSRSLPRAPALERARRLLDTGFSEIVLTGADLGSYGRDLGEPDALPRLVEDLIGLGDRHRVRLSSIEPNKLHPELLPMIGTLPRLCRHLHLPLQSGSNRILREMRRGYAREEFMALLAEIVQRGPVGIGTDVIVGFPGEGETEFEETLRFLEEAPVTFLHVFRYSARPGTAAAGLPASGGTDSRIRERSGTLRALGEAKRQAFLSSLAGKTLPVVMESGRGRRGPVAMSDVFVPVELDFDPESRHGILDVRITGGDGARLAGTAAPQAAAATSLRKAGAAIG
ncbi:MAG TPA: tRNA (N(6)-L-threonylcarbamoyladenosine(37)-C(2))-methylthiotransferase MtaB [Candidatus Limnocylindrales bacterium]|nr:tRNA (N(6)-L-threonylcarbamoyladenosine(37)-C(2))-methylthiotransferase MtaB [Candidatus Limnocylindrales bacterium]